MNKIKLNQIMLYLKSQKQTCTGALQSAIRKEDKTEKDYVMHEQPVQSQSLQNIRRTIGSCYQQ